ncbi:MAG: hypothetical protein IPO40_08650 [Fibrobacteres bacterium]|nr:hypothetical protein [Fibrobacterota bacterium]
MKALPWIVLALCAGALLSYPLSDHDLWWHLSAGRTMMETRQWIRFDPFCNSSLGQDWIDLHWGFQLLVFWIHKAGGLGALVATRILLVLLSLAIALRGRMSWETVLCACLGLAICRIFLDLRPLLVTLVLLSLLWHSFEASKPRAWILVPLLVQLALVNTQGLFVLGPLFILAAAAGQFWEGDRRRSRNLFLLAGAMGVLSLANPWGIGAFHLAGVVAGRIASNGGSVFAREIPENIAWIPWILESPLRALLPLWLGLLTFLFWRSGPGSRGRFVLFLGCLVLSLLAVRNLPFLVLASLYCLQPPQEPWRAMRWISPLIALGFSGFFLMEGRWNLPGSWIAPTHLPSEHTLAHLDASKGKVFHELRAGGWLSWKLPTRGACWADTRLVLHDEVFVKGYLDALDHPQDFERWSDAEGFRWALVPTSAWPRWKPLASHLIGSQRWRLAHADGAWALFQKTVSDSIAPPPFSADSVEIALHQRFSSNPRLELVVRDQWRALVSLSRPSP